jgi:REP element-mobilizing transposase RayT
MLIPKIVGKFKMQTSKQINILNNKSGTKTWQHDYYNYVIRNDAQYQRIKEYIKNNPENWVDDKFFV